MNYSNVRNQVLILFLIMVVGFYCRKKAILTKEATSGLSKLLLDITLPFMIINSFNFEFSQDMLLGAGKVFLYSVIIHSVLLLLTKPLYYKYEGKHKAVLRFMTTFSNTGFMGFPILQSIFGEIGVFYGSIFNIVFNVFVWTFGVMLYTTKGEKGAFKKVLVNPSIVSVGIGFVLFLLPIKLPLFLSETVKMVGGLTTPLSMIIIGTMLAEARFKDILGEASLYYGSFNRLLMMPLVTFIIMKLLNADEMFVKLCVVIQAMPAAVMTGIVAEKYGGDYIFASKSVFVSTVLSCITIPLIILLI